MHHHSPLARAVAAAVLIALAGSSSFARETTVPDIAAAEVTSTLNRLTTENHQRVEAAIEASIAALNSGAGEVAPVAAPARTQPTASVEVYLPRGKRAQRRAMVRG